MAMKINAGDDLGRTDLLLVNPFEILIREDLRGRETPPIERIIEKALSMLEWGNITPVECRRMSDYRLLQVSGFTRNAAARLIREGFEHEGEHYQDSGFRLKVLVVDGNDNDSLIHNIIENEHRDSVDAMSKAEAQRRLRNGGKTEQEIARIYQWPLAKVAQYRDLLSLAPAVQEQIKAGNLSVAAALEVVSLSEPEQVKTLIEASQAKGGGKVTAQEVKETVRTVVNEKILRDAHNSEDSPAPAPLPASPATPKVKPRNSKEIAAAFRAAGPETALTTFGEFVAEFAEGKHSDEALHRAIDTLAGALVTPANGKKGK